MPRSPVVIGAPESCKRPLFMAFPLREVVGLGALWRLLLNYLVLGFQPEPAIPYHHPRIFLSPVSYSDDALHTALQYGQLYKASPSLSSGKGGYFSRSMFS